ncbi:MAG: hypothetical protein WBV93_00360 [Anaerobacillus sp.]|nr:hypothetical protein [Halobacillus halophilus]
MTEINNNNQNKKGKLRALIDSLLEGCVGIGCVLPIIISASVTGIIIWVI